MLFGLIGPKFTIWSVEDKERDGEFISNKLYEFVSGSHVDGFIQLCFDGVFRGKNNRFSFSIDEETLAKKEDNGLGVIPLYTRELALGCQNLNNPNVQFAVLPFGDSNTNIMLRNEGVKTFLQQIPSKTHVFFYPRIDRKKNSSFYFVLVWRGAEKRHFYHFRLKGRTQREIIVTKWDVLKAFLKDYATWPYVLILLLSGAGSH